MSHLYAWFQNHTLYWAITFLSLNDWAKKVVNFRYIFYGDIGWLKGSTLFHAHWLVVPCTLMYHSHSKTPLNPMNVITLIFYIALQYASTSEKADAEKKSILQTTTAWCYSSTRHAQTPLYLFSYTRTSTNLFNIYQRSPSFWWSTYFEQLFLLLPTMNNPTNIPYELSAIRYHIKMRFLLCANYLLQRVLRT